MDVNTVRELFTNPTIAEGIILEIYRRIYDFLHLSTMIYKAKTSGERTELLRKRTIQFRKCTGLGLPLLLSKANYNLILRHHRSGFFLNWKLTAKEGSIYLIQTLNPL